MNARSMLDLVAGFTREYGVVVTYQEQETELNSRGVPIVKQSDVIKSVKVLLLKEQFSVLKPIQTVAGLSQDYTRYIVTLPDVDIKKDMIITDNHNIKWKLGIVDWFDIGGVAVAKQASLIAVA